MAKSRPTQSVLKGVTQEGFVLAQRKDGIQNVNLDVVFPGKEVRDVIQATEEFIRSKNLPLDVVSYYCQVARKGEVPSLDEWAEAASRKVPPGDKYFALIVADSANKIHERHLFKIRNGVPTKENLAAITESEFHKLALSKNSIDIEETYNVTTIKDNGPAHMPTVSKDFLQPVRDTEVPTRKDKIPTIKKQPDTEIPGEPVVPRQEKYSRAEIAAAEFGIPPLNELSPSNTSQLFREDIPKKSSDTLLPEDTDYLADKTEKDAPVLSPSQTSIYPKNDTPVPTKSDFSDDDFQLSQEDFDLSDEDSEHVVDLDGELGENTKFLERTPTGKLVKPDGEKLLDASAPSLKPVSSDTEMVPAVREPSLQESIKARLNSLDKKEDGYFGQREDEDNNAKLRGLTTQLNVHDAHGNFSGILGKRDIPAIPKLSIESEKDVGEDTELNMPPVAEDFGRKTEHLPLPQNVPEVKDDGIGEEDLYVLDAPKDELKQKTETVKKTSLSPEKSHAKAMKVISKLKDAGWDFDEHGRPARKSFLSSGKNGLILSKKLSQILSKGNISQDELILVPRIKMRGDDEGLYARLLKISENPDEDLRKKMLKIYDEQVKHNSNLSDDEKSEFYSAFVGREPKPKVSWFKRTVIAAGIASAAFIAGHFTGPGSQQSDNSDLESKLATANSERDAANSKYDKLSKEYQVLINSENDLKSQLESANKDKSALEEAMKSAVSKDKFDSLSKEYESLKFEEQKIKSQLENTQKEKSSLEVILESEKKMRDSQKSEYESQLSEKDKLLSELNEKYSSYVPKETLDEWVQKFSESESRFNDLRKEMDSLKTELDKYKKLGSYDDLKGIVDMPAVDSERLRKAYLSQLESFSVTDKARGVDNELNRNILSIRLTKYTLANEYEAQVWLRFMDIMKMSDDGRFGSREQAPFVASILVGAMKNLAKNGSKYDESALKLVISKYIALKGSRSDDKTCLSAAELTEEYFRINK